MARLSSPRVLALRLTGKLVARLLLAAFLVFGTYNPTGTSYYHWMRDSAASPVWKIVATGILAVAYGVVVPLVARALGFGGIALTTGLATSSIWVIAETGLVDLAQPHAENWILLSLAAFVLGIGLCWMVIATALDGQVRLRDLTR